MSAQDTMAQWRTWRWPVQLYVEASSAEEARRLLGKALDFTVGESGWITDQDPVEDGTP